MTVFGLQKISLRRALELAVVRPHTRYCALHGLRPRRIVFSSLFSCGHSKCTGLQQQLPDQFNGGDGNCRSYRASGLLGAKVVAGGPVVLETESDSGGKYTFVALPPGDYAIHLFLLQLILVYRAHSGQEWLGLIAWLMNSVDTKDATRCIVRNLVGLAPKS